MESVDTYSTLIPKEISDEIGKEDKIYAKHKKNDYEKQFMRLNIYYDDDSDIKKPCENIRAQKKELLKYTLNKRTIWKMSDEYAELKKYVNVKEKETEKEKENEKKHNNDDDDKDDQMKEIIK